MRLGEWEMAHEGEEGVKEAPGLSSWASGSAIHRQWEQWTYGVKFSFGCIDFQMPKRKR